MQGDLFNPPPVLNARAARAARDAGIARGAEAARPTFLEAAEGAIYRAAVTRDRFIVDEVWAYMPAAPWTHDKRTMGSAMLRAVKLGWIEETDEYRASAQVQCHANPRRVWASNICGFF